MNNEYLNPEQTLQDFFLLGRAFAFHDQTRAPAFFTYGPSAPQVVLDKPEGKISALQLLTSPSGGMATFVTPNQPVDTLHLEAFIREKFIPSPDDISLIQSDARQSLFLRFVHQSKSASYNVEFKDSRMALTHTESGLLSDAIKGDKDTVYLMTHSQFSISSRVAARLETDWVAFLTLAFNENARQLAALTLLLNQQIDAGMITVQAQFDNTPSEQTQEQVRGALVKTASLLVSHTLRNIFSVDEIPNKLSYDINYSNSVPQSYRLVQQQDIAALLSPLPEDTIITFTSTPLPEPIRPDKPIVPHECTVSLGFNPAGFNIMSVQLCYGEVQTPMPWPNFSPVTLKTESDVSTITLRVQFADYSNYETQFDWQDDVALTPQDLGFYNVLFEAEHLKLSFKSIKGSATYLPAGTAKKQSFNFSFSTEQTWQASWWINAQFAGLNGQIEYEWRGDLKTRFSKTWDSGRLQASVSPVKLQYTK